jgi:hypothetical protein
VLASADDRITLHDVATGKPLGLLPRGHRGGVTALAFSPNGKTLASGGAEGSILLWDVSPLRGRWPPQLYTLPDDELQPIWEELATEPEGALKTLVGTPAQAVPFLSERLRRMAVTDPLLIRQWVRDLDHDEFRVRQRAAEELEQVGQLAERELRHALEGAPSLELQRRVEQLLENDGHGLQLPPESRPVPGALRVLETLGTPEARRVMQEVARRKPGAWLSEQAKAALERPAGR